MTPILFWFKRDLRLHDNPALHYAVGLGRPIVPLFVVEPDYWALPDTSARQYDFMAECVEDLTTHLRQIGQPLVVRTGDVVGILQQLHDTLGFDHMISSEETGNAWTYARDKAVGAWARAQGIAWTEVPQCGVVRRLPSRNEWSRRRDAHVTSTPCPAPRSLPPIHVDPGHMPSPAHFMQPDPCPGRQIGGRLEGIKNLQSFLGGRGRTYQKDMSSPAKAETACSRLSPYLAFGALSVREVVQTGTERAQELRGAPGGWGRSLRSFQGRLAWRDHFIQKLEDQPNIETLCLHPSYEALDRTKAPKTLDAWATGQTGLPFVDACMRYLRHTGWINFRMRAMLMSVASYHLWLDWRTSGAILARLFVDYEPGIHWSQVQMQSGTTGMNTIRIYNPIKQGFDQDPDGSFIRTWVPELQHLGAAYIHEPWKAGDTRNYPAPIIDVQTAGRAARDKVWAVRKGDGFRAQKAKIVDKHASRKGRAKRKSVKPAPT
ncbi:MAG: FAD-binding domain-containing protein [Planktomarina sp.]